MVVFLLDPSITHAFYSLGAKTSAVRELAVKAVKDIVPWLPESNAFVPDKPNLLLVVS
jgi:hypothetical protein